MAIHYSFKVDGDTLLVHTSGFDESLEEVQAYGMAVIGACLEHGVTQVLCDESALEYRLGMFDTVEVANLLAEHIPALARAAIVCHPQFMADARLWEHVVSRRGLDVRAFITTARALRWLHGTESAA